MNRRQLINAIAGTSGLLAAAVHNAGADIDGSAAMPATQWLRQDYLSTPDGQLYFWTAGSGPVLLMIHQSGNSSEEFAALVPHLAHRFRMVAIDLPGHGRSDDPHAEPTVDDYTAAIQRVLDHLDISKAHVVGHHGGALAALNLAAKQSDRFNKKILSGIGGLKTPEQKQQFVDSLMQVDVTIRADSDFVTDTWNRYIEMMSEGASAADIMRPFIAFLEARLRPYRGVLVNLKWDRRDALKKLRGPVLLVQGDKDQYVSGQESLLNIIPDSTRVTMPGCGTFMFYDRPEACAAVIKDFLST